MEALLHELVRGLGYITLRVVTGGRYAGGTSGDELREGALGLSLLALITYVVVSVASW
jgi:hypothetical protein